MNQQRFSEAEAKKLLDRATELDAERAQSLDPAAVREIALEAGISPAAIDAAVAEHLEGRLEQQAPAPRKLFGRFTSVVRVAAYLLLAFIVYAFMRRMLIF